MNRREALERVALLMGGTVIGGALFLQGCKSSDNKAAGFSLSADQIAFLDEVAETIIPATSTPVIDIYNKKDQPVFVEGLKSMEVTCRKQFSKGFMEINAEEKTTLLNQINDELKAYKYIKKDGDPNHYFGLMTQLTLLGFLPGAKAAKVGAFMQVMVTDCYDQKDQQVFLSGLTAIEDASKKQFSKGFMEITAEEKTTLLNQINKELKAYNDNKKDGDPNHYFGLMKQLTLLGFFTSEVGAKLALRYVAVPGKYEGCIPYAKGDKAWAS